MKKLKFAEAKSGDWIYWVDYNPDGNDKPDYFVSNVKKVDTQFGTWSEKWWNLNHTLKKFNKIIQEDETEDFTISDFKGYDIIRKMTKKEIGDFKNKLIVDNL